MHQLLISVTLHEVPDSMPSFENYARAMAMELGSKMMQSGAPVHMVTMAHSPIATDPRQLGLADVMAKLDEKDRQFLMHSYPSIWLALSLLNG